MEWCSHSKVTTFNGDYHLDDNNKKMINNSTIIIVFFYLWDISFPVKLCSCFPVSGIIRSKVVCAFCCMSLC